MNCNDINKKIVESKNKELEEILDCTKEIEGAMKELLNINE